jgi:hypothetical protein
MASQPSADDKQAPHTYPASWLSGVYYLLLPSTFGAGGGVAYAFVKATKEWLTSRSDLGRTDGQACRTVERRSLDNSGTRHA